MLYPSNTINLEKIKGWVNSSLARAITQRQVQTFTIREYINPFYGDPWNFPSVCKFIELPDGYIFPNFPATDGVYTPILGRDPMAREIATELIKFMATTTASVGLDAVAFNSEAYRFFQWLYTWNTDLIWVDKVHPEDWVAKVLFGATPPTYAVRSSTVGNIDPDSFLRGPSYYVVKTWVDSLPSYGTLDSTEFIYGDKTFELYFPGNGVTYGKSKEAFDKQSVSRGIAQSILGILAKALIGAEPGLLTSQYWGSRLAILTDSAVYSNPYVSYLVRVKS